MSKVIVPKDYRSALGMYDTQTAIGLLKRTFEERLCLALNLKRVSAPLFVTESSGLNDNLSGKERPVTFDIPAVGEMGQVVHSLAKWKRQALKEYRFYVGRGLYTDMNAIRRDEELDNIHSIYVDQWDWEKVITKEERTVDTLIEVARRIVNVTVDTLELLRVDFPSIKTNLRRELSVIDSEQLLQLYPDKTPKEREYLFTKEHKTVLIVGIGKRLSNGEPHDTRAPDYDDWDMNGDILFYDDVLDIALEISSMGVRVDEESLDRQLTVSGCNERRELPFHRALLNGELPLTVGGGIGQSRLCMLMMGCAHIGEVQSSIWDAETHRLCREAGIPLL